MKLMMNEIMAMLSFVDKIGSMQGFFLCGAFSRQSFLYSLGKVCDSLSVHNLHVSKIHGQGYMRQEI